jgi:hypothetical protein
MKRKSFLLAVLIGLILWTNITAEEKVLTIPYSKQDRAYACGQNSFLMIMGYWGSGLTKRQLFGMTGYNPTTSKAFEDIVASRFPEYTYEVIERKIETVITAIDADRPVMMEIDALFLPYIDYGTSAGHYIVAVGYNTEEELIYLRDPNSPYTEAISYGELEAAWKGPRKKIYTIYRKDGVFVPPENITHFSTEQPLRNHTAGRIQPGAGYTIVPGRAGRIPPRFKPDLGLSLRGGQLDQREGVGKRL